ncbi:MAG: ArsR/SmtB family transcription factor [Candidatus Nanohalobium sp.]
MVSVARDDKLVEAEALSEGQLSALSDPIRVKILEKLAKEPSYPSQLTDELDSSKQKLYYHFDKLKEAELIEEERKENLSGGEATYYRPSKYAYVLDLGGEGEEMPLPEQSSSVSKFLRPLTQDGEFSGYVVAGAPDQHGPDQVRARDGHLTSEISFKLGNYARKKEKMAEVVRLDTEIVAEEDFDQSLLMVGGVLTNVVAKKFNESFPAYFPSEEFPYRELRTPENSYGSGDIGVITKTSNPENREESIFLVAGVREKGTEAAVKAFSDLENIVEDYEAGQFYAVVKGLDLNSDGDIDDYRVIEISE